MVLAGLFSFLADLSPAPKLLTTLGDSNQWSWPFISSAHKV